MIKIEKVNLNKTTPVSNRAEITGANQNEVFTQILIDVQLINVKEYSPSFTNDEDFPFYSIRISYNDGKVDIFKVHGSYGLMHIQPSACGKQLLVWLWNWPNTFKEVPVDYFENIIEIKEKDV